MQHGFAAHIPAVLEFLDIPAKKNEGLRNAMPRMNILNSLEREAFKAPPLFNSAERKRFFALLMIFRETMGSSRTPTNKVYFIVTAGYFKARRTFFAKQFDLQMSNSSPAN